MATPETRDGGTAAWPEAVDEILRGDQVHAMAYVTPARGVVLTPVTNTGLWDAAAGRGEPGSSSVAMWRKLERLRAEPRVAFAYHARDHGFSRRPGYVLVQGTASLTPPERRDWVQRRREAWERFSGPLDAGPLWDRWLRAYLWRVGIAVDVARVAAWPDGAARGPREVHGEPWPQAAVEPQRPPARGTGPRVRHGRAARRATGRNHVLLGWVGADGFPVVVPVEVAGAQAGGIRLSAPPGLVPEGGRRAGLLAHTFTRYGIGQRLHKHTGWLEVRDGRIVYAPHTQSGYRLPESWTLFRLASGFVTRRRLRQARRAGFVL